ncbi:MAG TPA: Holliday junction branch migration protein RuvA [Acidimicrobiales bacterium]
MIGSLRGTLLDRSLDGDVLIEVAGVGYRVTVAPTASPAVGEIGDDVFLWVHHHIREDAQTLYGFATREERVCFEALLGAHGVGPALALAILSVHGPGALREVIATQDVSALCLVPGVGNKTAARLLVELQSRLDLPDIDLTPAPGAVVTSSARRDVTEALAGLGYGPDEVRRVVDDLPTEGEPADLLREALRRLAVA